MRIVLIFIIILSVFLPHYVNSKEVEFIEDISNIMPSYLDDFEVKTGEYKNKIKELKKKITKNEKNIFLYHELINLFLITKRLEEADKYSKRLIYVNYANGKSNYLRGAVLHNMREYEKSKEFLIKGLSEVKNEMIYVLLARSFYKTKDYAGGFKYMEKAIELRSNDINLRHLYVNYCRKRKDFTGAIKQCEIILEKKTTDFDYEKEIIKDSEQYIGVLLLENEEYKKAEKYLKKIIKKYPKDYYLRFTLGICYLMLDKLRKAKLQYRILKGKDMIRSTILKQAIDSAEKLNSKLTKEFIKTYINN